MSDTDRFYDEMLAPDGAPRGPYGSYGAWFDREDLRELRKKSTEAERFISVARASPSRLAEQASADER